MSTTIQLSNESTTEAKQRVNAGLAHIAIVSTIVALICLVSLHFLSPEFDPLGAVCNVPDLGNRRLDPRLCIKT
jgi:hypothetical protein